MASFAVPLAFSSGAAPSSSGAFSVQVGLDVSYLPKVDDATATPTICRPDKTHPENTDLLFASPRPRAWLTLPAGFTFEASWIPPLKMGDVEANLWGFAVSRTSSLPGPNLSLTIRAHATVGRIQAPITCDDSALQNPASPCYQGTRSNDSFRPNGFGATASASWNLGSMIRPYLGAGYTHLAPRFQVNFTNRFGDVDRRKVVVDLDRLVVFAGVTWSAHRILDFGGEIYSAPVDAVTGRLLARLRLR